MIPFSLIVAFGFGMLYAATALAQTRLPWLALGVGVVAFIVYLIAFLVPPQLFKYTNDDLAPRVQTQVLKRALAATALVFVLNSVMWLVLRRGEALLEELYMYTLVAVFIFHGLAGALASHIVYLQQTKQYNSNQLVAILALVTLLLFVLILYFVALDWAIERDAYIHLRDLTLITLVLIGYGRAIYLMAHH